MSQPSTAGLIERLLADELDAAGFALLEERCRADAELAAELVERLQQEADLRGCLRRLDLPRGVRRRLQEQRVRDGVMQAITDRDSARWRSPPSGRRRRPHLRRLDRRRRQQRSPRWPATAALAATLLLGLGLALSWPQQDATTQAILIGSATVAGERLADGRHALAWNSTVDAAQTLIRHPDGSELRLTGRLRLPPEAGEGQWRLEEGAVDCHITPQDPATAFQLVTPHGMVTVLGTRFTVTVAEDHSLVQVSEGRVRVSDASGERVLGADETDRLGQSEDGWRLILVDPDRPEHRRRLRSGDRVSLAAFGAEAINLEVIPPPGVESLRFHFDGEETDLPGGGRRPSDLEQFPPYMVYGNHLHTGRLYRAKPPMGTVELRAEAFADDDGEETVGERRWILTFDP